MRFDEYYEIDEKMSPGDFPKKQWIDVELEELDDDMLRKLWKLYEISYASIGLNVDDIIELKSKYKMTKLVDLDDDPEPDAFIVYKVTPFGNKIALIGSDGQSTSKRSLIRKVLELLNQQGWYTEASHAFARILGSTNIPHVDDEETVRKVLKGKNIEWQPDGRYKRKISGKIDATKIMYGNPKL